MRSQEAPVGERERETKKGLKATESVVEMPALQAASLHPLGTLEIYRAHRHCPTEGTAAGGLVLSSCQAPVDCSSRGINSPLHLACDTCVIKSTRKPLDTYSQVLASDAARVECTEMQSQEIQAKHQQHPVQYHFPTFIDEEPKAQIWDLLGQGHSSTKLWGLHRNEANLLPKCEFSPLCFTVFQV